MKQGSVVQICCDDHDCEYAGKTGIVDSVYQDGTLIVKFSDDEGEFEPSQVKAV